MHPYLTLDNLNCYANPYQEQICQPVCRPPPICQPPPICPIYQPPIYQPSFCEPQAQMNYQWTPSQVYNIRWPRRYC